MKHLFHLQTRTVYSHADTLEVRRMRDLVGHPAAEMPLEKIASAAEPWLVKTHEMPSEDDYPAIYLVRDGRDALVSYAHFILHQQGIPVGSDREAFLRILRELITSHSHFGGWSANVLAWKQRMAPTVILRYEDLVINPVPILQEALAVVGRGALTRYDESLPSFEGLHQAFPWFFRKGKIGAWRTEMPEALHRLFWERHHEAMVAFHYSRDGSDACP